MDEDHEVVSPDQQTSGKTKSPLVLIIVAILIVGGAVFFWLQSRGRVKGQQTSAQTTNASYSLDQIAAHNSASDCWMAIDGNVYNVTPFVASGQHPGGREILRGCGIDATQLYNTHGRIGGYPHSAMAHALLSKYFIGKLK